MAQPVGTLTIEDYDGERSKTGVNLGPLTAVNFDAKLAAMDDYKNAVAGIILGEIRKTVISDQFTESAAAVASNVAQRESKWLCTAIDNTPYFDVGNTIVNPGYGNLFQVEIPTADVTQLTNNSPLLDLTAGNGLAFKTAFEAVANSPTGGNDVILLKVEHVGRNL